MNDLISRQAIIKWVKTECNPYGNPTLDFESGMKVIEHLKQMPSTRPEPKHGKWIPNSPFTGNCSECGSNGNLKDNYCPNCGAKMERSEE